jgi:hypothetical protein
VTDVHERVSEEAQTTPYRPGNTAISDEGALSASARRSELAPTDLQWKTWRLMQKSP